MSRLKFAARCPVMLTFWYKRSSKKYTTDKTYHKLVYSPFSGELGWTVCERCRF